MLDGRHEDKKEDMVLSWYLITIAKKYFLLSVLLPNNFPGSSIVLRLEREKLLSEHFLHATHDFIHLNHVQPQLSSCVQKNCKERSHFSPGKVKIKID